MVIKCNVPDSGGRVKRTWIVGDGKLLNCGSMGANQGHEAVRADCFGVEHIDETLSVLVDVWHQALRIGECTVWTSDEGSHPNSLYASIDISRLQGMEKAYKRASNGCNFSHELNKVGYTNSGVLGHCLLRIRDDGL